MILENDHFENGHFSFQDTEKLECLMYRKIKLSKLATSLILKHELLFIVFLGKNAKTIIKYLLSFFLPETF